MNSNKKSTPNGTQPSAVQQRQFKRRDDTQKTKRHMHIAVAGAFSLAVFLFWIFARTSLQYVLTVFATVGCVGYIWFLRNGTHAMPPIFGCIFYVYCALILTTGVVFIFG